MARLAETERKQQTDGGWALESLAAWKQREKAPPSSITRRGVAHEPLRTGGKAFAGKSMNSRFAWLRGG